MNQRLAHIALLVRDYDEAITFYTQKLDFVLVEDVVVEDGKRWVLVAPKQAKETCLLLAKAATEEQQKSIGNQSGGRVFLFLFTDNFKRDYALYKKRRIEFVRPAAENAYGTVAVFKDLYGNLWDLLEPKKGNKWFDTVKNKGY